MTGVGEVVPEHPAGPGPARRRPEPGGAPMPVAGGAPRHAQRRPYEHPS